MAEPGGPGVHEPRCFLLRAMRRVTLFELAQSAAFCVRLLLLLLVVLTGADALAAGVAPWPGEVQGLVRSDLGRPPARPFLALVSPPHFALESIHAPVPAPYPKSLPVHRLAGEEFLVTTRSKEKQEASTRGTTRLLVNGMLGALGLGLLGVMMGGSVDSKCSGSSDVFVICGNSENALKGATLGASLGGIIGVYATGSSDRVKGSFWATVAGGVAGGAAGYFLAKQTSGLSLMLLPAIGATIGFQLTR